MLSAVASDLKACSWSSTGTALVLGWAVCGYFRCTRNMTWRLGALESLDLADGACTAL